MANSNWFFSSYEFLLVAHGSKYLWEILFYPEMYAVYTQYNRIIEAILISTFHVLL